MIAGSPVVRGDHSTVAQAEQITDGTMNEEKPLDVGGGLESSHMAFPLPGLPMEAFVVEALAKLQAPLAYRLLKHDDTTGGQ